MRRIKLERQTIQVIWLSPCAMLCTSKQIPAEMLPAGEAMLHQFVDSCQWLRLFPETHSASLWGHCSIFANLHTVTTYLDLRGEGATLNSFERHIP